MALPELLEFPAGNYTSGPIIVDDILNQRVYMLLVGNYLHC